VGPRAGLDRCGKSRPTGIRSPDRPDRSQSLYRLSYPAHDTIYTPKIINIFEKGTLCSTKIKRLEISCVPHRQSRDGQLPS
jgi:hypothetical protein